MRYLGTKVTHGFQSCPDDLSFTVNSGKPPCPLSTYLSEIIFFLLKKKKKEV